MQVPTNLISLTTKMILRIQPVTHQYLQQWKQRAQNIPNPEFRKQALMSISSKTFHCEGGALYGLLARDHYKEAIKFIVAYQTISDYLDNLCDRSTSLNPDDFRALHESMLHALTPDAKFPYDTNLHAKGYRGGKEEATQAYSTIRRGAYDEANKDSRMQANWYYRFRQDQDDGGYLPALVTTCQEVLRALPDYGFAAPALRQLVNVYVDLQVHKHVKTDERLPRIKAWFDQHKEDLPAMSWYEFAASSGSTLGIFCIVAYLFNPPAAAELISKIKKAYFPWVQGLHILLDYFIDQEEDRQGLDLNFCSYYPNDNILAQRLSHFYQQAQLSVSGLPDSSFHHLINRGLLSIYLADNKVSQQKNIRKVSRQVLRLGGIETIIFYLHCWVYKRLTD